MPVAPAELDVEGTGAAADVEESLEAAKIDCLPERRRGRDGNRVHRFPEVGQHDRIEAIEERLLLRRVPRRRAVRADGFGELRPARIQTLVEHLDEAAEVVWLAAHQELVG